MDDKAGGEEKIPASGLHRRGHHSGQRISGSDRGGVPSHPRPKRGRP